MNQDASKTSDVASPGAFDEKSIPVPHPPEKESPAVNPGGRPKKEVLATKRRYQAALAEAAASLGVQLVKLGVRSAADKKLIDQAHQIARRASGLWGGKRAGSGRKRLPQGKKAVFAFGRVDPQLAAELAALPRRTRSAYLREAAALLYDILPPAKWAEKHLASGEKKVQTPDR